MLSRRNVLSPARLRADPWGELGRLHALPADIVRARAGRTRIAYRKGADPINDLLVRRADGLMTVNTITTPRLRRERFSSLGRLLSSDDRSEHLPTRKALTPRFSSAASASGLAEVVAALVADLVESLARAGTSDVTELTGPLAVELSTRVADRMNLETKLGEVVGLAMATRAATEKVTRLAER